MIDAGSGYRRFRAVRRFDHLDGLRAVSILLVLADHTADPLWTPLRGYLGVTVFFVISGFIITTLLLREESVAGRASIRNFYLRRIFRILPLYYLALVVYTVLVVVFRLGADAGAYAHRLPYYLVYANELGGSGTFSHTWSLGVEEKFYLVWPVLAFGVAVVRRHRAALACTIVAVPTLAAVFPVTAYVAIYLPIMLGCVLALAAHSARGFGWLRRMAQPAPAVALVLAAIVVGALDRSTSYVHVEFSYAMAAAFPVLLLNPAARRLLSVRPLVFLGRRSYAVYLFHPIIGNAVGRELAAGSTSVPRELARFVVILGVSLVVADLLYRVFEQPLILLGRRLTGSKLPPDTVPARIAAGRPDAPSTSGAGVTAGRTTPAGAVATGASAPRAGRHLASAGSAPGNPSTGETTLPARAIR